MISAKEKIVALKNLGHTFEAIENLDKAIAHYSAGKIANCLPKLGPAYVKFDYVENLPKGYNFQIERPFILEALYKQRDALIAYLATLGFDWDLPVESKFNPQDTKDQK